MFDLGSYQKSHVITAESARVGLETEFFVYGQPLANVGAFKCIIGLFVSNYYDWPKVVVNIRKVWNKWMMKILVLGQEVSNTKTSSIFFKAVVQSVILFREEMWVVSPRILRPLGGLH